MGSDKIIYWLGRYSSLLGFIMSKNPKGLWLYILIESSVCNLSCFFDMIKPRRKECLQSQYTSLSDPIFRSHKVYWFAYFDSLIGTSSPKKASNWIKFWNSWPNWNQNEQIFSLKIVETRANCICNSYNRNGVIVIFAKNPVWVVFQNT